MTSYTWDSFGRLATVTDPAGGVTTYGYDDNGNLISLKDAIGNETTFGYDGLDRLTLETDALGNAGSDADDRHAGLTPSSGLKGRSTCQLPLSSPVNPLRGKTIDRRAVCGRTARTVRRGGGLGTQPGFLTPIRERWPRHRHVGSL